MSELHSAVYHITIAQPEHVALLQEHLPTDDDTHRQRLKLQEEGKGLYLLAWQDQVPVGHALLHFRHPAYHASWQYYPESAYVEALTTHPHKRRQRIATSLMQIAEDYARQHRTESVGLSVGIDNATAQALYRKLAYAPTDVPPYSITWNYRDKTTNEVKEEGEVCRFWIKVLD